MVGRPTEPGQVRERGESRNRGLVAVEDEAREHEGTGDADGRAATQERGDGEGDGARDERQESEPDRVAGGRGDRDRVTGQRRERADDEEGEEDQRRSDRDHRDVAEELLERDPAASQRRRGDELQAPPPRLAGEGAGERQDRPQARDEREERAVLVLDVAAHRLDVDDLAGESLEDGRDRSDHVAELLPRLDRRELGDDRLGDADEDRGQGPPRRESSPVASRGGSCRTHCRARRSGGSEEQGSERWPPAGGERRTSSHADLSGVVAVLGEEGLLERRLAADEVEELVPCGLADDGRDRAGDSHAKQMVFG